MSDILETQRPPELMAFRGTPAPNRSEASVRDPAFTISENCSGLLELLEGHEADSRSLPAREGKLVSEIQRASYFRVKSRLDRLLTAVLMIVALPLMLIVGCAIMVLDGRPVFYRQTRVGRRGRQFRIWKFRTMCEHAELGTGAVWSCDTDPRVTKLGRWLRCSHLDELPQFLNVLAGDMNLIGPRPERPEFVDKLAKEIPHYADRLSVRPGITGLAQLRLGYDQTIAGVQDKVETDLQYIQTANVFLDSKILFATVPYIAKNLLRKQREKSTTSSSDQPVATRENLQDFHRVRVDAAQSARAIAGEPNAIRSPAT